MRKKIEDKGLEKAIFDLLKSESRSMTLQEITDRLSSLGMKRSPQTILRHINNLLEQDKIMEK